MKKISQIVLVLITIFIAGCSKNDCSTCTVTAVTVYYDVAAGTSNSVTNTDKYSLCDKEDVDAVNGKVEVTPVIHTAPLKYYKITTTTTCN